jgi:hypothetical protein
MDIRGTRTVPPAYEHALADNISGRDNGNGIPPGMLNQGYHGNRGKKRHHAGIYGRGGRIIV